MPDLTPWIEAQLKRGHTKEEVKKYLASKGYSQAVAAQVDKMKPSSLSNQRKRAISTPKSMPKGLASILPVVAVGIVAVLLLFLTDSFSSSEQQEKAAEGPVAAETAEPADEAEQTEQALPTSQLSPGELCSRLKGNDELACEELVLLVNSRYPGIVEKVEKQEETNAFVLSLVTKQGRRLVTASAAENFIVVKDAVTSELINSSTLR